MAQQDDITKVYSCSQCPKIFATRSNLKRHMENPNIHNIPYIRSRDQKRWKGHAKKVISKEETTERMRKWRAENREKNRQNDLRCRVYRLSRQKFGEKDSLEKQQFIRDEINRRMGRKGNTPISPSSSASPPPTHHARGRRYKYQSYFMHTFTDDENDNDSWPSPSEQQSPFYHLPPQKIQLPSIDTLCPALLSCTNLRRRTSNSSESSISTTDEASPSELTLPPVHTFLHHHKQQSTNIKHENNIRILDEFVGLVLDYVQDMDHRHHSRP